MMPPPLSTLAAFDARKRRIGSLAASIREPRPRTEETRPPTRRERRRSFLCGRDGAGNPATSRELGEQSSTARLPDDSESKGVARTC